METRTSSELHTDHVEWWKILCAWQEELKGFDRRLADILERKPGSNVLAQLEQFQNRVIREREVIDELQRVVKTHEDSLEKKDREVPHVTAEAPFNDHVELRSRMRTAESLHAELRLDFMQWAAAVRDGRLK